MEINWNKYFDHIFVISGCSNFERRDWINEEFKRIGINKFQYWYNFSNNKRLILHENLFKSHNYISYGHYSLIKTCYELGYDNILICEDDICFLNDLNKISEILEQFNDIKSNINIYLFDYFPTPSGTMTYADCYYLDRKGMEYLIYCLEHYPLNIDCFWGGITELDNPHTYLEYNFMYYPNIKPPMHIVLSEPILPVKLKASETHMVIQKFQSDVPYNFLDETLYNKY